jgi:RNase adaptor protein for sRNA GlmZ degradation
MATRTQIYLPPDEHRRARLRAAEQGISLTEYIRRLVHADLTDEERDTSSINQIIGIGDSGGSNVAQHRDEYVAEAIETHLRDRVRR